MKISVNGEDREFAGQTLAALVDESGFGPRKIATAVNGAFVPAPERGETRLSDGDRVEILSPMQGG
ncbi:sulfur carrier protein ThiS [Amaricoccus macauensis]|uniref:sulfur carrier protein ThiS n=1 Tax=Amaricoccus macauensis TaxID=57001 RepID=UPI003C7D90C0